MSEENNFLRKVYKLRENPFTDRSGIGPIDYFVGQRRQKESWTKAIDGRKNGRGSSLNLIIGDYGYGKTFSLWMILEQYKNDAELLSVYLKLLREDFTSKFGVDFIQRIFSAVRIEQLNKIKAKKALEKIPDGLKQQANVLIKWLDGDELAMMFLSGKEQLKATDLNKLGLRQNIKSTEVAKVYFILFLYTLKESGKPTLLLCVDECEYLFSQMRGAKVANVINTLRDIYDLPTSPEVKGLGLDIANIIFFLGITQGGWTNFNNLERKEQSQGGPFGALLSRVQKAIELEPFSREETEELIKRRLSYNSVEKRFEKELLIPYTKDFVEYVYELTLGNPRHIIERCDYTLAEGKEQRIPKLTRAFAEKVFESHGLIKEPIHSLTSGSQTRKRRKRVAR